MIGFFRALERLTKYLNHHVSRNKLNFDFRQRYVIEVFRMTL
ncbi:hypothetical protein RD1_0516 [Roseobacter denitrificans OCh 114]|uniref:Transposase n=1 Tax=Roseobacter denitrificans (strain ATCC 33942 / OCh 114) TaxID=375451 RepID=Q16CS0_ROSDO|nr:hypothetical protein RD1_0516 [Roseobacter denitrificans OCh 114]